jgi:hypothetical protein
MKFALISLAIFVVLVAVGVIAYRFLRSRDKRFGGFRGLDKEP